MNVYIDNVQEHIRTNTRGGIEEEHITLIHANSLVRIFEHRIYSIERICLNV